MTAGDVLKFFEDNPRFQERLVFGSFVFATAKGEI